MQVGGRAEILCAKPKQAIIETVLPSLVALFATMLILGFEALLLCPSVVCVSHAIKKQ